MSLSSTVSTIFCFDNQLQDFIILFLYHVYFSVVLDVLGQLQKWVRKEI